MKFDYEMQPGLLKLERNLVTDGEPLVTIVTPYFNGKKYFQQTVNCILNQTFPWFEWIIVNDGSTDQESILFLKEIEKLDARIKVVHKENGGISSARNYGMKMSNTKYVMSIDCDDLIEPVFVEYCWWMLEKNPSASWAYTDSVGFQNDEYTWKKPFDPYLLKSENHLTEVAFIRKKDWDEIGGYLEIAKNYNEDWVFYLRMVAKGKFPVQSKNDFLSWYRRHEEGVLTIVENDKNIAKNNKEIIKRFADNVIDPKSAIIYPINNVYFDQPNFSNWNKKIFKTHSKIHFLLVTAWLELGGADKFNLDLLTGLDKDKFEVSIITTVPSYEEPWQQRFRAITPEVFNLPNFMESKDYAEFLSYFINSREIDIVMITNSYHGYYLIPWLKMHYPKLIIIDYVHMEEMHWRKGGYARTSTVFKSFVAKTYVCNNNTKKILSEKFNHNNVEVIHIGVDHEKFNSFDIQKGITYRRLNINQERPIVLFICRLVPQKRPYLMLEIANKVKEVLSNVAFVVVGNGQLEDELKVKSKYLGLENTVYFCGEQDEVRPYYKDAKLTLICSIKEGVALTAYESLSMGVPVISSNVGGQSDLINNKVGQLIECNQNEESEYYSENYSQDEIMSYTNAIVQYLTDEKKLVDSSIFCRKIIEDNFSINSMINKFSKELIKLYQNRLNIKSELNLRSVADIINDYVSLEFTEQAVEEGRGYCYYKEKNKEQQSDVISNDEKFIKDWEWIKWKVGLIDNIISNNVNPSMTTISEELKDISLKYETLVVNLAKHEEILNRHEEVVNRHEEVVNRHEVEVNKHNIKIDSNYDAICDLFKKLNK